MAAKSTKRIIKQPKFNPRKGTMTITSNMVQVPLIRVPVSPIGQALQSLYNPLNRAPGT